MRQPPSAFIAPQRAARRLGRRNVIKWATAALFVGSGAVAVLRTRGYAPPAQHRLVALSAWQFAVVHQAATRIVAPDRPDDATIPTPEQVGVAPFVDIWVSRLPTHLRARARDLGRFLAYLEHIAPVRAGFTSRFTRLGSAQQDEVLASIESSSTDLLRAGFDGLRSLVFMGYYRDARTWAILGYDGPLVNRPAEGWR